MMEGPRNGELNVHGFKRWLQCSTASSLVMTYEATRVTHNMRLLQRSQGKDGSIPPQH